MKNKTVNYVIATWGGNRRLGWNYGNYTFEHISLLRNIKCNLSQITIVCPNHRDLESYKKFMETIDGSLINGTIVKVLKTENKYQSYSQYIEAFDERFDYHIFTEDDYVPVLDDFDSILIEEFDKNKDKKCGFLCGLACPCAATNSPWAAISWGISSREVLLDVDFNLKQLEPSLVKNWIIGNYARSQFLFSCIFLNGKYSICDIIENYESRFYDTIDSYCHGKTGSPEIISPIQLQQTQSLYSESFLETHRKGLRLY